MLFFNAFSGIFSCGIWQSPNPLLRPRLQSLFDAVLQACAASTVMLSCVGKTGHWNINVLFSRLSVSMWPFICRNYFRGPLLLLLCRLLLLASHGPIVSLNCPILVLRTYANLCSVPLVDYALRMLIGRSRCPFRSSNTCLWCILPFSAKLASSSPLCSGFCWIFALQ